MRRKPMTNEQTRHEFKVVIDGLTLPAETLARINEALQKAALLELASVDLGSSELAFSPVMVKMISEHASMARDMRENIDGGSTGGALIRIVNRS
jgi:hypothetical protein